MMQYLIIMLDDAASSYCCYESRTTPRPIPIDILHKGIRYAMCENLMIQFIYPPFDISEEMKKEVESIDHNKFMPSTHFDADAEVIIFNGYDDFSKSSLDTDRIYALRISKGTLFDHASAIALRLGEVKRLNIILTDVETFTAPDFEKYRSALETLSAALFDLYKSGRKPRLNLLTDRLILDKMNNCDAGIANITLAPNGKFYVCPAFYYNDANDDIGDLEKGLDIKNAQLFHLEYAPLCRICDAYQCRRCVWLNRKTTLEVNTPSHEQCVVSHLERNQSRLLLEKLRQETSFKSDADMKEIDYLDPFDILE
jgi:CXXX repeat peptide maturase